MERFVGFFLLLVILCNEVYLCRGNSKPLLLTPYLEEGQLELAKSLSRVDRNFVEEFVPDSFAGYMTTDKEKGHNLFFWFFPATQNQTSAPILLWLNGGPGISSLSGLFYEHGPISIDPLKSRTRYERRTNSWVDHFSMIYLDNPVGAGFSYSDGGEEDELKSVSRQQYVTNMGSFVEQFFQLFVEYSDRDFYIGGQSYAGKYVPALAHYLHRQRISGKTNVKLVGIYMGAPFFYPEKQSLGYVDFLYSLGAISESQRLKGRSRITDHLPSIKAGINLNASTLEFLFQFKVKGFWDNFATGSQIDFKSLEQFVNYKSENLRKALHVGSTQFQSIKLSLYAAFDKDLFVDTASELAEVMDSYKVLIYNGNLDVVVSTPSIELALMKTTWKHQDQYNLNTSRIQWYQGSELLGFYSLTDRFCRVVLHGAGHQAPRDKPEVAILMMKQFTKDGCVYFDKPTVLDPETTTSYPKPDGSRSIHLRHSQSLYSLMAMFTIMLMLFHKYA